MCKTEVRSALPFFFFFFLAWHTCHCNIEDVAEWMSGSMLKMNNDKTELIAIDSKSKICQVTPNLSPVSISGPKYFLSLLEILVSLQMKHSPWMCILNTCVVFFSVSYAD